MAQSLLSQLAKGGKTMYVLLLLSVAALAFALERLFHLRRGVIVPHGLAREADILWLDGALDELSDLSEASDSTLGRIIGALCDHRAQSFAVASNLAEEIAGRELKRHLLRAYPLAVVGTLAPLLGLLGTVFGMIASFEMVAVAGSLGDARLLADGISMALVTTAAGLIIAVPALALYHFFRNRLEFLGVELEEQVNALLRSWFLDDHEEPANLTEPLMERERPDRES